MRKRILATCMALIMSLSVPVHAAAASDIVTFDTSEVVEASEEASLDEAAEGASEAIVPDEASESGSEGVSSEPEKETNDLDSAVKESSFPEEEPAQTLEDDVEDFEGEDVESTTASHAEEVVESVEEFNDFVSEQSVKYPDKKVVLIQDTLPWSRSSSDIDVNRTVLQELCAFDVVTTSTFVNLDLRDYSAIIFANDQGLSTYKMYDSFRDKMEQFASSGGTIVFGACDQGWASGSLSAPLPGGITKSNANENRNRIVNANHPVVTGRLTGSDPLTDADLVNNYCSHVYFNKSSFPSGTQVILEDSNGNPTLIEYPFGNGRIIASGLTWEHAYRNAGSFISSVTCGQYAKKALDDLYAYAISTSGIGNNNIDLISDLQIGADEHYVIVIDAITNKPLEDAEISADSAAKGKTDKNGRLLLKGMTKGTHHITVKKSGYYNQMVRYEVAGADYRIIKLNSVVNGGFNINYINMIEHKDGEIDRAYDLTWETANIKPAYTYRIAMKAEWTGKEIANYCIYRDGKYAYSTDGIFTVEKGKFSNSKGDKVSFSEGRLSVRLIAKDGTRSEGQELLLYSRPSSDGAIWGSDNEKMFSIGKKVSFTVPDKYPVIGNTDFSIDIDKVPVSVEVEDTEVKIVFGVKDFFKFNPKESWEEYKKKYDAVKRTKQLRKMMDMFDGKAGAITLKKGWDPPELDAMGYAVGKYDPETGVVSELRGEITLEASVKYSYNQQFLVGYVPLYFEIGGGLKLGDTVKVRDIVNDEKRIVVENNLVLTPSFKVGGGLGVNGALSVGGEGNAELPVVLCDTTFKNGKDQNFTNVSLSGEMKLKASALFVLNVEHSIAKGNWQLLRYYWDTGETEWFDNHSIDEQAGAVDITDTSAYTLMGREYLSGASEWYTKLATAQAFSDSMTILKSGIMPTMQPKVLYLGEDKAIMVFQDDDTSRNSANRSTLMYSVLSNGVWSEPAAVWDNGIADGTASLATGEAGTYVVWQKMNKVIEDDQSLDSMAACSEIAFAKFDEETETFANPQYITNDNTLQMVPVAAVGNSAYAVYVENDENALLGGGNSTVVTVNLETGEQDRIINYGSGYVSSLDAKVSDGKLSVASVVDTDGDINTLDDTEVRVYDGVLHLVTDDDKAQVNAQYSNGILYWYDAKESSIKYYDDGTVGTLVENNGELSQNFKVFDNGSKKAVVWIGLNPEEEAYNVVKAIVNSGNGFSEPVDIVSSAQQIMFIEGFLDEGGNWQIVATAHEDDGTPVLAYTEAIPYITTTVSDMVCVGRSGDEEFYPLDLNFANNSEDKITRLNVEFRNPETDEEVYSFTQSVEIPGGASQRLHFDLPLPLQRMETTYDVYVYPDGEADFDDNHALITLGNKDVELKVSQSGTPFKKTVEIKVTNNGEMPVNAQVYLRQGDRNDGVMIKSFGIDDLPEGASRIQRYEFDLSKIDFADKESIEYYVVIEDLDHVVMDFKSFIIENPYLETPDITSLSVVAPDPVELDRVNNKTYKIKVNILPEKAANSQLSYSSSNPEVASVDEDGLISAAGVGSAVITVSDPNTGLSDTVNVVVTAKIGGKISFDLEETSAKTSSYQVGDEYQIVVRNSSKNVLPADMFEYVADNKDAAFVDNSGKITLLKEGKVKLTVKYKDDPSNAATKTITVKSMQPGSIGIGYTYQNSNYEANTFTTTPANLKNSSVQIVASVHAENGQLMDIASLKSGLKYSSGNAKVASVDSTGLVKGTGVSGTAVITVTVPGTKLTNTFTIFSYDVSERAPQLLSDSALNFNIAKSNPVQYVELQAMEGTRISSVYSNLYTKSGKSYKTVSGFSISSYKSTDNSSIYKITANTSAKSGNYYIYCSVSGYTYYIPVKVTVTNKKPSVKVAISSFNAFYTDEQGIVTIDTDETINSVSMSIPYEKGLSSGGYSIEKKSDGTYAVKANSGPRSSAASFAKYNKKYVMRIALDGYREAVEIKGSIPVKYTAPTVSVTPSTVQLGNNSERYVLMNVKVNGVRPTDECSIYSASYGSINKSSYNGNGEFSVTYLASSVSAQKSVNIYVRSDKWGSTVAGKFTLKPATKKAAIYKVSKALEYNTLTSLSTKANVLADKMTVAIRDASYTTEDGLFTIETVNNEITARGLKDAGEYTKKQYKYKLPVRGQNGNLNSNLDVTINVKATKINVTTSNKTLLLDSSVKGHMLTADILLDKKTPAEFSKYYNYSLGVKKIKVKVYKGNNTKAETSDIVAEYVPGGSIRFFNNRVCQGTYTVEVSPVLTNDLVLTPVKYTVKANNAPAKITATGSGNLNVRKRDTSRVKVTLKLTNTSAGITKAIVENSYSHAITISQSDFTGKTPVLILSLKHYEKIPTGKYSLPIIVSLSDGSKVKTTCAVNITDSKLSVSASAVTLTRYSKVMSANSTLTLNSAGDSISSVELVSNTDLFTIADNGDGTITVKVKDGVQPKSGKYSLNLLVHTMNDPSNSKGTSVKLAVTIK